MKHLSKLMLVVACLACGQSLPEPKVGLREAVCKSAVLLAHLGNNESLVNRVLDGTMTVDEAVYFVGGLQEDAADLHNALIACEPLVAPPPQPGSKVL